MLLLDSSVEVGRLTVYRDHLSRQTFHYLPGQPRVVSEELRTGLELLRFRGEHMGGLLNLDIELAHDEEVVESARQELSDRIGANADLVPVLFHEGAVRLALLGVEKSSQAISSAPVSSAPTPAAAAPAADPGSVLVEHLLGAAKPSLLGHQRAIFSVELSPEGATLLEAAIRGEHVPVMIVYDLAFSGLRPARGVRARVDYTMAYNHLRSRLTGATLWFKCDLDREAETLERKGHIQIEDVDYQGSDPAILGRRREEVRATLNDLMETLFFRPGASPAGLGAEVIAAQPALVHNWVSQGGSQAAFVLRELEQHEQQVLAYDYTEARVSTQRVAPQGTIRVPSGADPNRLIVDVTTSWPPSLTHVRAFSAPDADWSGIAAIQIDLREGQDVRTLVLTPQTTEQTADFSSDGVEYRLRALRDVEPDALVDTTEPGGAAEADAPFEPLRTTNLAIDPQTLSERWLARIQLGQADLATIQSVTGELKLGTQQRKFFLNAHETESVVPVWGHQLVEMRAELVTADREIIVVERTLEPSRSTVLINQPRDRFHVVEVMLQDPLQRYEGVMVELEAAEGERRTGVRLDAGSPSARWSAARSMSTPGSFRYRVRKVGRDANVVEEDWLTAAGSLLVVGDLDVRIENIEGFLLGAAESLGAVIQLSALEPPSNLSGPVEVFLEPGQSTFKARLPFRSTAEVRYTVSAKVFFAESEKQIPPHDETSEALILAVPSS